MSELGFSRPSVIAPEAKTKGYEGAGVAEAAMNVKDGIANGDWFGMTANTAVVGLSAVGAIMDPFAAVISAGVGWAMEHLSVLREPLDWLAGDPKEIEGHAATWRNIEGRIYDATDFFVSEVNRSTEQWTSQAAAAYQALAKEHAENVQALGTISDSLAEMTLIMGGMVGVVRNTVRDVIAEVVGAVISKALQALLVVTIPKIAAEIALMVAECSAKILNMLKRLTDAVSQLVSFLPKLAKLLDNIGASLTKAGNNALILGGYRAEAAGLRLEGSDGLLRTLRTAHGLVGQGHHVAHGGFGKIALDALSDGGRNNALQNSGQTADSLPDDDPKPGSIELPL